MLRTLHIYLIVKHTEAVSPRYWREQFFDHLSEMSSEAIQSALAGRGPALPGPHMCQPGRPRTKAGEARKLESRLKIEKKFE